MSVSYRNIIPFSSGIAPPDEVHKQPIQVKDQIYGWVSGGNATDIIAVALSQLVAAGLENTHIGDTVNRTSRFCDGASGGQVLINRDVYTHVGSHFAFDDEIQIIKTNHSEREPNLEGHLVLGLKP